MPQLDLAGIKQAKADLAAGGIKPSELAQSHVRDSVIAWSWANGSIIDRQTRTFPSALSKMMSSWLCGLNYTQLLKLKEAGPAGIHEHVAGKNVIAGVPPVGKLPAIDVRYPPAPVDETSPRLIRKVA
jgi:hypothetical protein